MGLFDKLKPSYNFAKNIKLILEKVGVDTSKNNIITGEKLLLIHDSISDILTGFSRISPDLNMKILIDIKKFLDCEYKNDIQKINQMSYSEKRDYLLYKFNQVSIHILDFTYEVMFYSANINGLPYDFYNENDKKIVRDVFGF